MCSGRQRTKLRSSMDASEYKHVVLGLIVLKYVEDAFEERRTPLRDELAAGGITGESAEELLDAARSRDEIHDLKRELREAD
jgi:type I restriction-modification system DNA methylase subunit